MHIHSESPSGQAWTREGTIRVLDLEPKTSDLLTDAAAGLRELPRTLPCKYLYDQMGSALFEQITELDEYYPTRTELAIMAQYAGEMADAIGPKPWLIEFGCGSGLKTERLVGALHDPVGLVLVDISRSALVGSAELLAERFAGLDMLAVCADYTQDFSLPEAARQPGRITGYFPGSTVGNFTPAQATQFLSRVRRLVGDDGSLLIGFDRTKDTKILEAAYDDRKGVTGAFNLNLMKRLKDAGADVEASQFKHRAIFNGAASRIEMHLVSQVEQQIGIGDESFQIAKGESICTEHSHKYDLESFASIASAAGFSVDKHWSDEREWFSVVHLVAA